MGSMWGNKLKLSIFGESHGKGIGIVVDGIPGGIELDMDYIEKEMKRRAPGNNKMSTPRKEGDSFSVLSGFFQGKTTGTPLCAVIFNENTKSKDYDILKDCMRPGHADYTGHMKYNGSNDYRGGGHFSGRITAPLVFAGAVAMQILERYFNIVVGSHVKSIYNVTEDKNLLDIDHKFHGKGSAGELLKTLRNMTLPVLEEEKGEHMEKAIMEARAEGDSVGGVVETAFINMMTALGNPFFDSVESRISHMMFSIPAVKGIEFGSGFEISSMRGSKANDEFTVEKHENNKGIKTTSNNNGGILGGITSGMPLVFRVAIKPTPSIAKLQHTVNIETMENTELVIEGRHDPCIVPRAIPVIESAASLTILDMILEREGEITWKDRV
ncbi:chorismate synthase [Hathewaya proteolytica DSM 3090]|uniref:Chorismate synthase n=1 Tax=Hathewaya proteolytica DSM 3090 TaxID=1121331 RepID=A0A1M6QC81_9CLOT|nr:chorismate synthase [Hathewaya proteolytica]SHK17740.1 chorismate synthase [Hathewaya proteolytica DSM 3090]